MKKTILFCLIGAVTACNNNSGSGTTTKNGADTAIHNLQQHGTYVRQNIYDLPANSPIIADLRKGVAVMMARDSNDPTSWIYQAKMHGTTQRPLQANWNQCQHGTFFFMSWHRMYLYYFERILRKACDDPNFALPYWNYTDDLNQMALPAPFRYPMTKNSLYTPNRNQYINDGYDLPESAVSYRIALSQLHFATNDPNAPGFGGTIAVTPAHTNRPHGVLENQPHDQVHGAIGGWMGNPNTAAKDPIFWLHHANIDRLWLKWLLLDDGRSSPVGNRDWLTTNFTFYDENGHTVTLNGGQILNIVSQLNYCYDDMPEPLKPEIFNALDTIKPKAMKRTDILKTTNIATKGERTNIRLGSTQDNQFEKFIAQPKGNRPDTAGKVMLLLSGVTYDSLPSGVFEVYINLPLEQKAVFNSDYYAGNIGLFGFMDGHDEMPGMKMGGDVVLDITDVIRRLKLKNQNLKNIQVSIFHRGLTPPAGSNKRSTIQGEIKIKSINVYGLE